MKILKYTFLLMLPLLLSGCGPRVTTVNPMDTNLSNYNTFAYLPNTIEMDEATYDENEVNEMIISTISENMRQAGFTMDRDNPDVLVLVSVKTDVETATETEPVYARYPYAPSVTAISPYYANYYYRGYPTYVDLVGYNTDTYSYEVGTLVIDLIDSDSRETVWKGVTSAGIYNRTTTGAITDLVNEIFDEYPMTGK